MEHVIESLFRHGGARSAFTLLGYIDPSTGSLVFQVVAASIISAGLFIRGARDRIIWLCTAGWRAKSPSDTASFPDSLVESIGDAPPKEPSRRAA